MKARNAVISANTKVFNTSIQEIDVNAPYDDTGACLLHLCVIESQLSMLNTLIDVGADVNVLRNDRVSPLWLAVCCEEIECVNALIAAGAEINTCNHVQISPLHLAAKQKHPYLFKLLISKGADLHHKAANGQRVLDICKQNQLFLDIINHKNS